MRLREAKRDLYRRLAAAQGYRSRAAFKLIQIDERYNIFKKGDKVLDLGAAPGGWLQVASKRVGSEGLVVGVDIKEIQYVAKNVSTIRMDVFSSDLVEAVASSTNGKVDVILSDLSPNVSGVWELDHSRQIDLTRRVLSVMPHLLKPSGSAVLKVFDGEDLPVIKSQLRKMFEKVDITKPLASRGQSSELYFVCKNYKPEQDLLLQT
ncbi:MAG: RlmE family RNA methyltransferase [Nitrososphaerales archaeon]